jgi:hypothetical protein
LKRAAISIHCLEPLASLRDGAPRSSWRAGRAANRYPEQDLNEQLERVSLINAFYAELDKMFIPYMRLDQRMPLWWWAGTFAACKDHLLKESARRLFGRLRRSEERKKRHIELPAEEERSAELHLRLPKPRKLFSANQ